MAEKEVRGKDSRKKKSPKVRDHIAKFNWARLGEFPSLVIQISSCFGDKMSCFYAENYITLS
jgi:hypothetical protein